MRISTKRVFMTAMVGLLCLLVGTFQANAQNPDIRKQITISAKEMPMRTFLSEIEKQCNHTFFYSNSVLNEAPNVTLEAQNLPLEDLLHKVFDGSARTFEVVGNTIAIKFAQSSQSTEGGGKLRLHRRAQQPLLRRTSYRVLLLTRTVLRWLV